MTTRNRLKNMTKPRLSIAFLIVAAVITLGAASAAAIKTKGGENPTHQAGKNGAELESVMFCGRPYRYDSSLLEDREIFRAIARIGTKNGVSTSPCWNVTHLPDNAILSLQVFPCGATAQKESCLTVDLKFEGGFFVVASTSRTIYQPGFDGLEVFGTY